MEIPVENRSKCFDLGLFLRCYYRTVFKSPEFADDYYKDKSVLARPATNNVLESVNDMQAIKDMILSLDFKKYEVEMKSADSQKSYEGGLMILVHGNLTGKKDHMQKEFAQSFFLAPQDKGYYIFNDVLRYVHANGPLNLQSVPTTFSSTVRTSLADKTTEPEHTLANPLSFVNKKSVGHGVEVDNHVKNEEGSVVIVEVTQSDAHSDKNEDRPVTEMTASDLRKDFTKRPYASSGKIASQNTEQHQVGSAAAASGPEVSTPISTDAATTDESHDEDIPMQFSNHAAGLGSSVDMPMPFAHTASTLKADSIGSYFVRTYYHYLMASPKKVLKFYEGTSELSRTDTDGGCRSARFQILSQAPENMIFPWDFEEYDVELKSSDAQESYDGGMMVLVTGCLIRRKDQKEKSFVQSFFLAPRENGYYVYIDDFRYVYDRESWSQQRIPATVSLIADIYASDPETPFDILYYKYFCQSPEKVQEFYKDTCVVTRPDMLGTMRSVTTKQAINNIILSLDFKGYDVKLESSFIPRFYHAGWILLVTGFLVRKLDQMHRTFVQSFFIAPRDGQELHYDVINDIFRYFHETPFVPQSIPPTLIATVISSESDNSTSGSESTEVAWHSPDPTKVSEKLHASRVRQWRSRWCKVVVPNEKRIRQVASGSSTLASSSPPLMRTCCCKKKSNKLTGKWNLCCPVAAYVPANKEEVTEQHEVDSAQFAIAPEASTPVSKNATATSDSHDEVDRHSIFIPRLPMGTSVAEVEENLKKFGSIKPDGVQVIKVCFRCGGAQVTSTADDEKDDEVEKYYFGFVEFEALSSVKKALKEKTLIIGGCEALICQKSQLLELEAVTIGGSRGKECMGPYRSVSDGNFYDRGGGGEEVSSDSYRRSTRGKDFCDRGGGREEVSSEEDENENEATSTYRGEDETDKLQMCLHVTEHSNMCG